ncbi:MAG: adenylate/guanylate cyclase domain-containing protein [Candidatus Marinimicrobia bacterium]|nr:adenylate/guanylate cyclase domain-containing protein [Candidatus Neomarinimicrobiota bacterium]
MHRAAHGMEAKKLIEVNKAVVEAFLGRIDQTAAAMDILHAHNTIVRRALEKHGGHGVKHTGDGIMASFVSVAGSLNGAIDIQRGVSEYSLGDANHNLQVKIGLSAGEPVEEDQDLFGTSVQLAARICDHASAEEILVAHTVQELSAGKGFSFGTPDEVLMKGFDTPTKIISVIW